MKNYKISACIVTYNSETEIRTILNALLKSSVISIMDVYVVDNCSTDNTKNVVENEFPSVKLLKLEYNIGFGAGHNKIIMNLNTKYHFIVNPDIHFEPNLIEDLLDYMDENEDICMVTPKILNPDGTEQFLPKLNPKIRYFLGGRFEKYGFVFEKWRSEYTRKNEMISEPTDIEFSTGCFMMSRTNALRAVKGFDERYFLHFEDADLSRMLVKEGRLIFNPNFTVTHLWKRDNVKSKKIFLIALNSMMKYFIKWGL
ncbi:glycosyltransferase family 2 protein [Fusibacter sp. 3D3]|uniref:glycosyltransferase family 2 protein n=1 Tax=Fusibacter sp. 3D3 TaxID=1048380 RepID=UPI000852CB78|nr:glycosyltransferase family 2 protein [Fusibacter sp. 3D3]GAU77788.1 dTDP-Rha:A-D-GlcNAc-diphosphoryl polyprenol, A-3-L-rhamnosyl transferase WbbL [Fusibacter sp. 3D3]